MRGCGLIVGEAAMSRGRVFSWFAISGAARLFTARCFNCGAAAAAHVQLRFCGRRRGRPFGNIGQGNFDFRRSRRRVWLDQSLARVRRAFGLRQNRLPRMKCVGALLRQRFCWIALWARFWVVPRQRYRRQIRRGVRPREFNAHRREIRRVARQKMPDGKQQQSHQRLRAIAPKP